MPGATRVTLMLNQVLRELTRIDWAIHCRYLRSMKSILLSSMVFSAFVASAGEPASKPLFPADGVPKGWTVRTWSDLKVPAEPGVVWKVQDGVLNGSEPRGTWLISEEEFADFILDFEWKLGPRGNSGVALRVPMLGDPAFDGMELQMVDPRYYPEDMKVPPSELTGSLYKAVTPSEQLFKPEQWNHYRVTCRGQFVKVELNGKTILDVDLAKETQPTKRHDNTDAPPLQARPRKGHIGFQELSRGGGHVEIRKATIQVLDK